MSNLPEDGAAALALVATEWFRAIRRLQRLTTNLPAAGVERERAQRNYSTARVTEALGTLGLRLVEHDGTRYSAEIPAEPVNPEDFGDTEDIVVLETLEPTVVLDGKILLRGQVVLAKGK